ncbi:MAG: sugar ABC transporter permease [Actinobacteria bacterium]|nr:sugar ABC transporter permease [Actinomycetota bacterium]
MQMVQSMPSGWRRSLSHIHWFPYLSILPVLVVLTVILLYPLLQVIAMSFRAVDLGRPVPGEPFIGFGNYSEVFGRPQFWQALSVTAIYTVSVVILTVVGGLLMAQLLNAKFRGRAAARMLLILPWALPPVVTGLVWSWMFDYQFGVINYVLRFLHIVSKNLNWNVSPDLALPTVIVATTWKTLPLATIILLAGLQSISGELYEAAHIDGANALQRYRHVTLPGLRPVLGLLLLLETLWNFKMFTYIYMMTGGGPARSTESLVVSIYFEAMQFFKFGYAAALGVIVLIICLAFTLVYLKLFIAPSEKS